jgi:hypothetical protein
MNLGFSTKITDEFLQELQGPRTYEVAVDLKRYWVQKKCHYHHSDNSTAITSPYHGQRQNNADSEWESRNCAA